MEIEVEIFNMNNMTSELHDKLDTTRFFEEELEMISHLNEKNGFFKMLGVEVEGLRFRIIDKEKFIRYVFSRYFDGYKIKKTTGEGVGQPDYTLTKGGDVIYLELKIGMDSLRQSQIKWFTENKEKNNKLIFIDYEDDFSRVVEGGL